VAPAAAPTDDALLSSFFTDRHWPWPGVTTDNRHSTAFEVVPITAYNTARGFGVSDQELLTNKAIISMAMLLLLLLLPDTTTATETGTGRQHSDHVAPPPLYGHTVGSLGIASVQRTTPTSHSVWAIAHTSISSKLPHTCSTRESACPLLLGGAPRTPSQQAAVVPHPTAHALMRRRV
jgi:hypothetical protein